MENPDRQTSNEAEISLAGILNILWRRRLILLLPPIAGLVAGMVYGNMVTPLFRATATVRPGITAFSPDGGGAREWRLKDITRWFHGRMYRVGVAERMGISPKDAPPIRADFIERGLQNIQGGTVITLSCLDPDPERAKRALDAGIEAFQEYAAADSFASSIDLTRRGLQLQIQAREAKLAALDTKAAELRLDLELVRAKSDHLAAEDELTEKELRRLDGVTTRMENQLKELLNFEADLAKRLSDLDAAAKEAKPTGGGASATQEGVRPSALMTEQEVFRGLLTSAAEMRGQLYRVGVRRDSLAQRIDSHRIEIEAYQAAHARETALKAAEIQRELAATQLELDQGIPTQRLDIQMEIRERRVQLAALSPLERIGATLTSEGPVRPRKQRATMILTFMGLLGGFVLAFVWDYLSTNRRQIFQA